MKPTIIFDEYAKIEIRVGTIVQASVPEGSEKLIKFEVEFGPPTPKASEGQVHEIRTIFAGIKEWYSPEELIGVKTAWVTNIPPKMTPFGESQGMLFACDDKDGKPYIVRIGEEVEVGSEFH
ncbi:MAG: methionine--tRNA ligase subunit beta [bacterium]